MQLITCHKAHFPWLWSLPFTIRKKSKLESCSRLLVMQIKLVTEEPKSILVHNRKSKTVIKRRNWKWMLSNYLNLFLIHKHLLLLKIHFSINSYMNNLHHFIRKNRSNRGNSNSMSELLLVFQLFMIKPIMKMMKHSTQGWTQSISNNSNNIKSNLTFINNNLWRQHLISTLKMEFKKLSIIKWWKTSPLLTPGWITIINYN